METICLQCGDVGFDAYVYCVKCVKFAVHRYCLPEIPKTFDEIVRWVCNDCEAMSLWSVGQKVVLTTQDGRCIEHVISTSTSYSHGKSISQSSQGVDENNCRTGPMLQSVHENLVSGGDAQLADDRCLSGSEPNANNDLSQKENVLVEHELQSNSSRQLDEVEEVEMVADESLQSTRVRKESEVSSSLSGEEKQRLPTTSNEKRFDVERQSDTSRHSEEEEAEVAADKLSKRRRIRENSDISSAIPEKEKQKRTTSNDCPIAYEKKVDDPAPSRFSPMRNECQSSNLARTHGVEEATEVVAKGSSRRTRLELKRHISTSVTRKEKQVRRSTSPNQFSSRQRKRLRDRSFRSPPSRNDRRKDRSRSLDNIGKQRYSGPSSKETPNSRRPTHNAVREREKKHVIEESMVIPTQSNGHEEVSRESHGARKPMHETVRKKHKERVKDRSSVIPTITNSNEEVSRLTHEARKPKHYTAREKVEEQVKEESLVIPTHSNVHKEVSRQPHETRKPMHNAVRERYKEPVKEESSVNPTRSNGNGEVSRDPIITQPIQVQPVIDPIWRGRFCIVNKKDDTLGDFVAHLSSRACPQVIAEAKFLRSLLRLEMVPKSTVWPKSFHTLQPSDDNIALYIFPAERRFEKMFDRLVDEMSDQELAMRTTTENAELLIFPSTELPMKYWRFQNKYFIWGVFKAKKSPSANTQENHTKANM